LALFSAFFDKNAKKRQKYDFSVFIKKREKSRFLAKKRGEIGGWGKGSGEKNGRFCTRPFQPFQPGPSPFFAKKSIFSEFSKTYSV